MTKFITISELSKTLKLINPKTKKPLNHILRYWEKEFKEIKPKKINNRRYYSKTDVDLIRTIKSLLKDQKLSINGVKQIFKNNTKKLDENNYISLIRNNKKKDLKLKSLNLLKKIEKLRIYGKKNTS